MTSLLLVVICVVVVYIILVSAIGCVWISPLRGLRGVILGILGGIITSLSAWCARCWSRWRHRRASTSAWWRLLTAISTVAGVTTIALTSIPVAVVTSTTSIIVIVVGPRSPFLECVILLPHVFEKVDTELLCVLDFIRIRPTGRLLA